MIPAMQQVRSQVGAALLAGAADYAQLAGTLSHAQAAAALSALCDRLPAGEATTASRLVPSTQPLACPLPADDATHDRYFHVRRVTQSEGTAFLRSVLTAAGLFHQEMDSAYASPDAQRFAAVGCGFAALLGHIAGIRLAPVGYAVPDTRAAPTTVDPMRRWVLGHHIFAALTQGIIFALQDFEAAMCVDDEQRTRDALTLAADLMTAAATAFRFTADFPPAAYRDTVRPSMMGEDVGEGFSGLLSVDHRRLVAVLVRIRPLMEETARRLTVEHKRLNVALSHVYGDHKFVCARFGGAEEPSLRCPHSSALPAVEQLDRYQRARVDLLRASRESDVEIAE
jgi:hypothetical protein